MGSFHPIFKLTGPFISWCHEEKLIRIRLPLLGVFRIRICPCSNIGYHTNGLDDGLDVDQQIDSTQFPITPIGIYTDGGPNVRHWLFFLDIVSTLHDRIDIVGERGIFIHFHRISLRHGCEVNESPDLGWEVSFFPSDHCPIAPRTFTTIVGMTTEDTAFSVVFCMDWHARNKLFDQLLQMPEHLDQRLIHLDLVPVLHTSLDLKTGPRVTLFVQDDKTHATGLDDVGRFGH